MNEPAYVKNFRAFSRAEPKQDDLEFIEKELYTSGSDRAVVVLFGSFLDTYLERLLLSKMRQGLNSKEKERLFGQDGAAGTFSSKIGLAYAICVIGGTTRDDLNIIRLLRNEFAHSRMPIRFSNPEVAEVCAQLKLIDRPETHIPFGYLNRVSHQELESATDKTDPKTRFVGTCHTIAYRMHVKRSGPQPGDTAFPNDEPLP